MTDPPVLEKQEGNSVPELLRLQVRGGFCAYAKSPLSLVKASTCLNALLSRGLKDIPSFRHVLNYFVKLNSI